VEWKLRNCGVAEFCRVFRVVELRFELQNGIAEFRNCGVAELQSGGLSLIFLELWN
jgi:hypothetical protein